MGRKKSETEKEKEREIKIEKGRIALYQSLILYIVPEKTRAREKRVPAHATVDVEARADAAMACMYLHVYIRMYTGRTKSPDCPYSNASARARALT